MNKKSATQLPDVVVTALKLRLMERQQHLKHQQQILSELELEIAQLTKFLTPAYTAPEQCIQPAVPDSMPKPKRVYSEQVMEQRREYQRQRRAALAKADGRMPGRKGRKRKYLPEIPATMGVRDKHTGRLRAIQGLSESEAKSRDAHRSPDPIDDPPIEIEPTAEQAENINEANLTAASHNLPSLKQKLVHLKSEYELARSHASNTEAGLKREEIEELSIEIDALERVNKHLNQSANQ